MVVFQRILTSDGLDRDSRAAMADYAWYFANGIVYMVDIGGQTAAFLLWAWLGADGIWAHVVTVRHISPAPAAAAILAGLRLASSFGLVVCQADSGCRMAGILRRIGFRTACSYFQDGFPMDVFLFSKDFQKEK